MRFIGLALLVLAALGLWHHADDHDGVPLAEEATRVAEASDHGPREVDLAHHDPTEREEPITPGRASVEPRTLASPLAPPGASPPSSPEEPATTGAWLLVTVDIDALAGDLWPIWLSVFDAGPQDGPFLQPRAYADSSLGPPRPFDLGRRSISSPSDECTFGLLVVHGRHYALLLRSKGLWAEPVHATVLRGSEITAVTLYTSSLAPLNSATVRVAITRPDQGEILDRTRTVTSLSAEDVDTGLPLRSLAFTWEGWETRHELELELPPRSIRLVVQDDGAPRNSSVVTWPMPDTPETMQPAGFAMTTVDLREGPAQVVEVELGNGGWLDVELGGLFDPTEEPLTRRQDQERLADERARRGLMISRLRLEAIPARAVAYVRRPFRTRAEVWRDPALGNWPLGESASSALVPSGTFVLVATHPARLTVRVPVTIEEGRGTFVRIDFPRTPAVRDQGPR